MRKDVRFGLSIAAVFVAVVVVYIIVLLGNTDKPGNDVTLVTDGTTPPAAPANAAPPPVATPASPRSTTPVKPAVTPHDTPAAGAPVVHSAAPVVAHASAAVPPPAPAAAANHNDDPWRVALETGVLTAPASSPSAASDTAPAATAVPPSAVSTDSIGTAGNPSTTTPPINASVSAGAADVSISGSTGSAPTPVATGSTASAAAVPPAPQVTITEQPRSAGATPPVTVAMAGSGAAPVRDSASVSSADQAPSASVASALAARGVMAAPGSGSSGSGTIMVTSPPTSRPSGPLIAAVHSHTVAPGETYSSISAALFGNAKYWPEIAAANPKIDPKRLHPGLVLVIPDIPAAAVTPAATAAPVAPAVATPVSTPVAPIDAKTQYRVQSGDSLYRIAVRLYGNGNLGEKIYDINKDLIGPDPAKLKPGQILKLPQAPGQSTAAADAPSASASTGR